MHKCINILILCIVINAENASLKSDKFTLPNNKARLGLLKTLIETGVEASQVARSYSNGRYYGGDPFKKYHHGGREDRPKSAGAPLQSARSNNNVDTVTESPAPQSITTELPPIPSISRSNVLRDLKSLTRRKSGSGHQNHASAARLLNSNSLGSRQLQQQRSMLLQHNSAILFEKEGTTSILLLGILKIIHTDIYLI